MALTLSAPSCLTWMASTRACRMPPSQRAVRRTGWAAVLLSMAATIRVMASSIPNVRS